MKIGFIGCGNMAQAMIGGILNAGVTTKENIYGADAYPPTVEKLNNELGIKASTDNKDVASACDIIVLSVKPQFYEDVITEIAPIIQEETLIITIAPGQTIERLNKLFGKDTKIVRTMPNTPALVGEGMTAMCLNEHVTKEDEDVAKEILNSFGRAETVPEYMMDAVTAISGSSPAYVFMMIEAMADAAVLKGMNRKQAYTFAAQAVYGSAKMVLETGKHPGELKDMVTSPAGTTIEAVKVLEDEGFRSALIKAMEACAEKSASL